MINCNRNSVKRPKIGSKYRTTEILERLGTLFNNKCYLCETQQDNPENFQVEHFNPQKNNTDLKYTWENLYLICGDTCNQYKGAGYTDILDPCNPDHDVENLIIYDLEFIDKKPKFYPKDKENTTIKNTCELLNKIHNGANNDSINKTASLRNAIDRQAKKLQLAAKDYFKFKDENIEQQKAEQKIKDIVSRKSPYTMLMRSEASKDNFNYLFD